MEAIKFKETSCIFAENQPEYIPLPAYKTEDGEVITCWKFTFMERIRVLFFGRIYLSILTFNKPLQPVRLDTIPIL